MSRHTAVQDGAARNPGIGYEAVLDEFLKDSEFRREWEACEVEYQIRSAIIRERLERGMTQSQLAEASGINQRVLSRIEVGGTVPTVRTLEKIAQGLGMRLTIGFEPLEPSSAAAHG